MGLINKKQVKVFVKKTNLRVSSEFYEALNSKVEQMLLEAKERSGKNGRNTIMPIDL